MQRRKTVRLHESQLRSIVQALIVENANRNPPEFDVPPGAVGMTVKTYLQPMHKEELGEYMEAGMDLVLHDEEQLEELLDSDDDDELNWARELEMEREEPDLVGYNIREVDGLLHVDIHANTDYGLDMLEMVARNCEEDHGDINARRAMMDKAKGYLKAAEKKDLEAEIERRMDKHLVKPTAPTWGSAKPSSYYGRD